MAKITPRLEKRKKWLEEKKSHSRVTRARVAQQSTSSSPKSVQSHSYTASKVTKSKHSPPSKNKTQAATKTYLNVTDVKSGAKTSDKPSKTESNGEVLNDVLVSSSKAQKKSKYEYVDPVEKLENSSSIHVPKKLVLVVGNLPEDITKEQVTEHFRRTGGVKSVKIPKYKGTETGKGFAYVEFKSTISHRLGLRLNNTTLAGRKIVVEFTEDGKISEKQLSEKIKQKNDEEYLLKMPFDT